MAIDGTKRKVNFLIKKVVLLLFFIFLAILALLPFYAMLLASFKPTDQLFINGITLRINPRIMSFKNYITLFMDRSSGYWYWYRNSIVLAVLATVFGLFLSSVVGYALAIYQFKGKRLVFLLVIFVMMIPTEILLLPLFQMEVTFRLVNTYAGVLLPFLVSPTAIFFFRQYATGLPNDFVDAARIDGCTEYGIYLKIMLPLLKPAMGAMTILLALNSWNHFIWPLIIMRTNNMLTLPVGLDSLISADGTNYAILLTGAVLSVLPVIIVFLANQDSFISGLTVGGVKG